MAAAVPFRCLVVGAWRFVAKQAQVSFVNERGGLERLPRFLLGQLRGRQLPQLIVNQRQELFRGVWIATFDGAQDACDVVHGSAFLETTADRCDSVTDG